MMTVKAPRPDRYGKGDRALELYEQKVPIWVIAERLGSPPSSVCAMINKARARRDKAAGEVSE